MSSPSLLRSVRAHFGLRQHELAEWLGVSRLQVAHVEADLEHLPRHAEPWLWPWLTARGADTEPEPDPSAARPVLVVDSALAGPAPLVARLNECRWQAEHLRQRLVALEARSRLLRRRVAAGPFLLAALPPDEDAASPTARRHRWVARFVEAATDALDPSLKATGPTAEDLLAARRSALLHEAAWLDTHLSGVRS